MKLLPPTPAEDKRFFSSAELKLRAPRLRDTDVAEDRNEVTKNRASAQTCRVKNKAQFSSVAQSCPTLCDPMNRSMPGPLSITNSRSSLRLTSIESVMSSSHLILCRPLLLLPPSPPSIRVFSNESTLRMRWPKYWSFSFSIIPSKEYPGLISCRMNLLDLLPVQGTLKSLL